MQSVAVAPRASNRLPGGFQRQSSTFFQSSGVSRKLLVARQSVGKEPGPPGQDDGEDPSPAPGDWDNAWAAYRRQTSQPPPPLAQSQRRPGILSSMEQYVTRDPTRGSFPLDEETDNLKVNERYMLDFWSSQGFYKLGLGFIAGLVVYMVVIVGPPPV